MILIDFGHSCKIWHCTVPILFESKGPLALHRNHARLEALKRLHVARVHAEHLIQLAIEDASPEVARLIAGLGRTGIVGLTEACHIDMPQFFLLGECHV